MKKIIIFIFVAACCLNAGAQSSPVYSTKNGAIDGYDPVAFFMEGKPVKGKNGFSWSWEGAEWFFSSQANLQAFKKDPASFAPQFGGYCAFGIADGEGHKAPTQADTWSIVEGKLYLNFNQKVKSLWIKNRDEFIKTGEENWSRVKQQ